MKKLDFDRLFEEASKNGIVEAEVCLKGTTVTQQKVFDGKLEDYSYHEDTGLSLRGIYQGRMGYSYTEKLTDDAFAELLKNLMDYAGINTREPERLAEPPTGLLQQRAGSPLEKITDPQVREFLLNVEKRAYAYDSRISVVQSLSFRDVETSILIRNTAGVELTDKNRYGVLELLVTARSGEAVETGYSSRKLEELTEDAAEAIVEEACGDAVKLLGAASLASCACEVILRNNAASDLFSQMSRVFQADFVQRDLSRLKGRLGDAIASQELSIIEDPLHPLGTEQRTFDDEGTPALKKWVLKDGILETFLHDRRSAEKAGVRSTGNGFRQSHKSSIEIGPTNLYIEEGEQTLEEMIHAIEDGVIITEVQGLHAGVSLTSGDFSLQARGFLIKGGMISAPLSQITVGGNFFELLHTITAIGSDLRFASPGHKDFGSPSLKISRLTIAGNLESN